VTLAANTGTVRAAYDALAPTFGRWNASIEADPWERFVSELETRVDDGARVVDLGCGDGTKTRRLAERFEVVGVDVSPEQLRLARTAPPEVTFVEADFSELDFPADTFDTVTAFYSIMHVPRDRHLELFGKAQRWLKPGGLFLASLSTIGGPDRTENWLGLLLDDVIRMTEPEGETAFLWVLGRRPG
jgi:ubiquinone/menaquinone biosynthesis C-methylase UbiE